MPRPDVTRRPSAGNPGGDHDADIYDRYAVGLYRQALFDALPRVAAARVLSIRWRRAASLARAVLRVLMTSPAAAVEDDSRRAGEK